MLVTNTFLSKCNTISDGSLANTGLNPILQLYYGNMHTRGLLYFDVSKIKNLHDDKTYPDLTKLKHTLKMWNASDINIPGITKRFPDSELTGLRERATSFDLLLYKLNQDWDEGRGFDFSPVKTQEGYRAYSEYGSNWYQATSKDKWEYPGVFNEDLELIGEQPFDFGNEHLEIDITTIFNNFIQNPEENHGFLLMFSPELEEKKTKYSQYCGFFTNNTNTFFEPYVQSIYEDAIKDDRASFYIGKQNRLYFYSNINGNNVNLDNPPTCCIENCEGAETRKCSTQQSKGVYYVDYTVECNSDSAPTTYYDKWDNIKYKGITYPAKDLTFTSIPPENYFQFGLPFDTERKPRLEVTLSGINQNEKVPHGEIRKVVAHVRAEYTSDQEYPGAEVDYRIYTIFDNKEMDVISWQPVDIEYTQYTFPLDADSFVPQKYHIDLRVKYGNEVLITPNAVSFEIVSNANEMKG